MPEAVLSVGGTIGQLILSPDRCSMYYLNLSESVLGRIDTRHFRRDRTLKLLPETDVLALSPNGKTLVGLARSGSGTARTTTLQVIDAAKLGRTNCMHLPLRAYDLVLTDGPIAYITGAAPEWTDVSVVDLRKGAVAGNWGSVWSKSFVRLSQDGRRLYVSSQGVIPGTLEAFPIPGKPSERPVSYRAANHDRLGLGGEILLSPDSRFVLCKTGTVLGLSSVKDDDMRPHARLEPFLSAAIDVEGKAAYLVARDGTLAVYSYPEFRLRTRRRLAITAYRIAVDGKTRRLYVAGFDPRSIADQPRAKSHGDIHVYALK
jgi:hypothetical protein